MFVFQKLIDRVSYERKRDKLRQEQANVSAEMQSASVDELDVAGILSFAETAISNASATWSEVGLAQKQRLQQAFFPAGLEFNGSGFETAATCLAFNRLGASSGVKSRMASPTGFEPVLPP